MKRRELLDLRSVSNATEHIGQMPEPGCSLHAIMRGNYSFCDLIPAVLRLIEPARLDYVAITTLGFSTRAAKQVLGLIDSGGVARLDFVVADFFEKADGEICGALRHDLDTRGSRFTGARCHAKVMLMQTSDGQHYVSEGSANIRAFRSIEQFCLTNDRELFDFHHLWINELFADGKA